MIHPSSPTTDDTPRALWPALDDEPPIGPGWYESTRDLMMGATVREIDTVDEAMTI